MSQLQKRSEYQKTATNILSFKNIHLFPPVVKIAINGTLQEKQPSEPQNQQKNHFLRRLSHIKDNNEESVQEN